MRRILLICTSAALILLPAVASAGAAGNARHGFLVVRNAAGDRSIYGHPMVTVVVQGFVLGGVSPRAEARVDIYFLPGGANVPQARGLDVSRHPKRWRGHPGVEYRGSGFRFRAIGGAYRVVVRGSGLYLFAGGQGRVWLRGSSVYPRGDGTYSVDGATPRSLPTQLRKLPLGAG
jgi:hypothetical protein